ncbi:MAG TPA: type IV pilin protein [Steroidobacteraceae bacterium]|nr:type IV pilin protein [Steroidobacteraceae bacterium]
MVEPFRNTNRPCAHARGFTLIELMVVVAIVAILGTIAVSTYRNYILRTTRTEGRMALLATQVGQEKYFLQNNQYAPDIATVIAAPPAGLGINLTPAGVTSGGNYTVSFAAVTANTYTLQAVATGAQANDTAACLIFTINEQGQRTPADSTGCWR